MTHRFPIKEIARQAGLGTATVDRVLNGRPHVSPQTRNRVAVAIAELSAQERQLAARGRRLFLDIVAEAPHRFTREIRRAAEAAAATVSDESGTVIRLRFIFQEVMTQAEVLAALERIRKRGSQGLCLKVRDTPRVRAAVARLAAGGIPVFTLVTDLPGSARTAYIGLDNRAAGRVAAHLIAPSIGARRGAVLAVRSQEMFEGEAERLAGFREELSAQVPACQVVDVAGGAGLPAATAHRVEAALAQAGPVAAVYSIGGGNRAILDALGLPRGARVAFVAHDLDRENRALLQAGEVSFVVHHDLVADMRHLFAAAASAASAPGARLLPFSSEIQVITPHNIPAGPGLPPL
jgi:LacI family transcriptional regulator